MREWRYNSSHSLSQQLVEVSVQFHAGVLSAKESMALLE
jgi:hypothetical protein